MKTDTIAAIATALSESGIGIIRISGPEAIEVADRCFATKSGRRILKNCDTHTIHYGFILNQDEVVDEVMVTLMRAPRSYTTEDTVEINCHGGVLLMRKILETVLENGARMAEPGEFTKRAFLNGRIDLSKAEAVMDLIHSSNDFAMRSSVKQLRGVVSEKIKSLRAKVIYEIAFIESALDDPEHISTDGYNEKLSVIVDQLLQELKKMLASADNGRMLKEGIQTVIVGKPNAGKSSLLNLMVGEEKAIVTDIAGTTRDVLEESIRLRGIGLNVIDTAGIRATDDVVERIGVERAKKSAGEADLLIYVVDTSVPLDESDQEIMEMIGDRKCIVLFNKTDLEPVVTEENFLKEFEKKRSLKEMNGLSAESIDSVRVVRTSTKEKTGLDELEDVLEYLFFQGKIKSSDEVVITNMRHKEALQDAYNSLLMVKRSLEDDMPEDFYSIDLMSAYTSLGYIIGEEVGDDLVNEIFSKFCMGK